MIYLRANVEQARELLQLVSIDLEVNSNFFFMHPSSLIAYEIGSAYQKELKY